MTAMHPMQIGGDDTPQEVLAKTGVARQWLDAPAVSGPGQITLRVSAHIPGQSPAVQDVFEPAFKRLAAMTGGAIGAEGHWGGSLHKEREGIEAAWGDYWVAYRVTFETQERVIAASSSGMPRYEPYTDHVEASPRPDVCHTEASETWAPRPDEEGAAPGRI